jgi:major membrane immunogen (membrane-anchored lipoprotein)
MKKIILLVLVCVLLATLVGCGNKQIFDVTYNFKYAYVTWEDGTSEKKEIKSWTDYEDGDSIQVTFADGSGTYLFHASNCTLGTD